MHFVFSSATAAQSARRKLAQAGIPATLRKTFDQQSGCRFVVSVSEQNAAAAGKLLQGGRV